MLPTALLVNFIIIFLMYIFYFILKFYKFLYLKFIKVSSDPEQPVEFEWTSEVFSFKCNYKYFFLIFFIIERNL